MVVSPEAMNALVLVIKRCEALCIDIREIMQHPNCTNCMICQQEAENKKASL